MPRLTNTLPKYRKHRASGQAIVTLGGRDIYLGPHGTTASKREYDRLIAEWLANGRRLVEQAEEKGATVVELCLAFWKHCQEYYRKSGEPTSEVMAIKVVMRDLKRLYARLPVSDFGPSKLRAVRQLWLDRDLARTTINQNHSRLLRVFRWGVAQELVPPTIIHGLDAVDGLRKHRCDAREPNPVLPVADDVVEATLAHLPQVTADMVRFMRLTGCRPGELFILRPGDVDRSRPVWQYRPSSHKTEHHARQRVINIGPKAQSILAPYLLRGSEVYCFSPHESEQKRLAAAHQNRKTPLNQGNRPGRSRSKNLRQLGDRYTDASFRRAIARACNKAKVPSWSPNQLRHAAATEIRSKFGLEHAQTVLGHSKANTTERYAERDSALAAQVIAQIG